MGAVQNTELYPMILLFWGDLHIFIETFKGKNSQDISLSNSFLISDIFKTLCNALKNIMNIMN